MCFTMSKTGVFSPGKRGRGKVVGWRSILEVFNIMAFLQQINWDAFLSECGYISGFD